MTPFVRDNLRFTLKGKKILLGITGSIAAFKACDIVRYLADCGATVRVVLSQGAENFVTRVTLETLSGNPVLSGFWSYDSSSLVGTHHIDTARWADIVLIAPATANMIAKLAMGMADDLLSTEVLAFRGPLLVAPAMNPTMFSHPAVQDNIAKLKSRGTVLLGPVDGSTSCGESGLGRMLEPEQIVEKVATALFKPKNDKHILITLGPTRSPIDPVRFISNRSSGLMGASLCWAAAEEGYSVTAVSGSPDAELPSSVHTIQVQTAQEMADAASRVWKTADIFISTAAVLDWDVKNTATSKIKKCEDAGPPRLELKENTDILATLSKDKKAHQFVLGFAAETDDPIGNGLKKLRHKGCDAIFSNDVSRQEQGFESNMNGGWWLNQGSDQSKHIPTCEKTKLARALLKEVQSAITSKEN